MEIFYSLANLDKQSLCELYLEARDLGKHFVEYDRPGEEGDCQMPEFPLPEILENICSGDGNMFAFTENMEDMDNCITIGLPLPAYPYTTAYVELDNSLLDRFVKKYSLEQKTGTGYMGNTLCRNDAGN